MGTMGTKGYEPMPPDIADALYTLLAYLHDAEKEHYADMKESGDDVSGHILTDVVRVQAWMGTWYAIQPPKRTGKPQPMKATMDIDNYRDDDYTVTCPCGNQQAYWGWECYEFADDELPEDMILEGMGKTEDAAIACFSLFGWRFRNNRNYCPDCWLQYTGRNDMFAEPE